VTLILLPVVHERSEYRRRRCVADDGSMARPKPLREYYTAIIVRDRAKRIMEEIITIATQDNDVLTQPLRHWKCQ
jgi:hypothetical protein